MPKIFTNTKIFVNTLLLSALSIASVHAHATDDASYDSDAAASASYTDGGTETGQRNRKNNSYDESVRGSANNSNHNSRPFNLSIDKNYSMHVGADLAQAGLWGYQLLDDTFISSTEGDKQIQTMFARFGKALVENTLASWMMILQHERFGHGARLREFNVSNISYTVRPFSGETRFASADYAKLSPAEKVAANTGGMEGTYILANGIRDNWLKNNSLDVRAAQLYFVSYLDQPSYIFGTSDSDTTAGNDVNSYVSEVNAWHGEEVITKSKLRSRAKLDFLDPFLFYSAFGIVNYVVSGEQQYDYYMIPIGGYKYLPGFRSILAPWGTEWLFNNYIKNPADQLLYVGLRHGKNGNQSSNGLTVKISELFVWNNVCFDARADLWKQPDLRDTNASTAKSKFGIAAFSTASYKVSHTIKLFGQLGYKEHGYIPGETLKSGFIARAGVGLNI